MRCKSVLVVEDDPYIQEALKLTLELEGYNVYTASNGSDAIATLGKIAKPCLILLDLMMPVMNGRQFLALQKEDVMLATIPVVVVSAAADAPEALGAAGYIKKPVELGRLIAMVERYCGLAATGDARQAS